MDCFCKRVQISILLVERRLPRANLIFGVGIAFCKEVEALSFFTLPRFISDHRGEDGHCPAKPPLAIAVGSGPSFSKVALFGFGFLPVSWEMQSPGSTECDVLRCPAANLTHLLFPVLLVLQGIRI